MNQVIRKDRRAVVISSNDSAGPFAARLYVNCSGDLNTATATLVARKFRSLKGAQKFAMKELGQ